MSAKKTAGTGSKKSTTTKATNTSDRATSSKPTLRSAAPVPAGEADILGAKASGVEALTAAVPFNPLKAGEFGKTSAAPKAGAPNTPTSPVVTGSTVTESTASAKVGAGIPAIGADPGGALDRVRADGGGLRLTTNLGVPISNNQSSLKAGLRGPTLLEDFVLREKITHFDHERIPERIVHARGSAAHGFFECYEPLGEITRASVFAEARKKTPVFARFSTVVGERGSPDTARDIRGFAVKFYTDEGNWDLVGNNIPVFFIQDAMKFPDLVHAAKPEPHHGMPQAGTAHDTFWDFVSLMPESTHVLMWAMSDRGIPRSYRMMQGFGVHTFRFINETGASRFVKFHWRPLAGTHSLDWDEAVKISGADPDFHRRDLWEAIESGAFPEWELGAQLFTEEQADEFSFDILDATKLVPEELVPVTPIGRMVLNRNPDNFFAETEQVAFCTAHVVPGIDFSNDPLLAGRIHSYVDTQISRLGGPNFHEIPINAPLASVANNQRDGMHRQTIHRGRVAYEPNSLGGGCPFQAGMKGFRSFPEPIAADKVRGKPEKFAEHYNQARLFWNSQSPIEKAHILRAFRFELSKVEVRAIRERMVASLANVDDELAEELATSLGMSTPEPLPLAAPRPIKPEVERSGALSLLHLPGDGSIRTRKVAILVADGVDAEAAKALHAGLAALGAVPRYVGPRLGAVEAEDGECLEVEATLETTPSVLYDAVAIPGGEGSVAHLATLGHVAEFIRDQYRHAKTILALGEAGALVESAGARHVLRSGQPDPGVLVEAGSGDGSLVQRFADAIARHRHHEREMDPPEV